MARPNVLFVLSDQFRAMCLEDDPVRTPHLDRFAGEGIRLRQAVSCYPVCSPHRAMLMTGLHPTSNGVPTNVNSTRPGVQLRDGLPTWASVMREAGYQTGLIGKWHLQEPLLPEDALHGEGRRDEDGIVWDAWSPPDRRFGFDFWHSYGAHDNHLHPHYWTTDASREEPLYVEDWSPHHETDVALGYLADLDRERPFALFVSWNPPHQPFDQVPDWAPVADYAGRPASALLPRPNVDLASEIGREAAQIAPLYYAAVECIDAEFGRLVAALDDLDLARDTIVVFTSDHGQQMGSHDLLYKNVPWEESMRLPCIVRVPGVAAGESDALFDSADIAPTLLGLCGLTVPDTMQGRDLAEVLRGDAHPDADAAALYYRWPTGPADSSARGLRTTRWKYVATREADQSMHEEVFDLVADPHEVSPLVDAPHAGVLAQRMLAMLEAVGESWEGSAWVAERHASPDDGAGD